MMQLQKIKESLDQDDLEDQEINDLKERRKKAGTDILEFARLSIFCYDFINSMKNDFKENSGKIRSYLNQFDIGNMRNLLSNYDNEYSIGNYYTKEDIKKEVEKSRKKFENLINVFFTLFVKE